MAVGDEVVDAEAKKKPPTSHKDLLVAVGCKVGAQNTDMQPCIRAQGRQDPEYPIQPLPAMAPSWDPASPGVKRTSPINRTCNILVPPCHWHAKSGKYHNPKKQHFPSEFSHYNLWERGNWDVVL